MNNDKKYNSAITVGATFMVIGVIMRLVTMGEPTAMQKIGAVWHLIGSISFATGLIMQQNGNGAGITISRLYRIQSMGGFCLVLSGLFMTEDAFRILEPLFSGSIESMTAYYHYIYNNWAVLLLIGGMLVCYSTIRLINENSRK